MTKLELEKIADNLVGDSMKLMGLKNSDYTCGKADEDALFNFNFISNTVDQSPMVVWSIYFLKHVLAVIKYTKSGFVESEGIKGRLMDIINYAILLYALILESERNTVREE